MAQASRLRLGLRRRRGAARQSCLSVALALLVLPSAAGAQSRVPAASSVSKAEFSGLLSLRELSDGSVLLADAVDTRLLWYRFDDDTASDVARTGSGPIEFRSLNHLFDLGPDSTVMADMSNGRWLLLVGNRVAGTIPIEDAAVSVAGSTIRGTDTLRNILTLKTLGRVPLGDGLSADSLAVVRVNRATGRVDTVAKMRSNPAAFPASTGVRNPMLSRAFGVSLTAPDQAVLFRDGWIALAFQEPYRVDWIAPDGTRRAGAPLPFRRVRVDDDEKRAHLRRLSRGAGRRISASSTTRWAEFVNPFGREALFMAPDGRLVVRRQQTAADDSISFDIVDRQGNATGGFRLPETSRLIGFGARTMYVALVDADGLERLSRRAWPPTP